jgi:hypothetical protein
MRLKEVAFGGGLILCPTHNVQIDTPVENILAFYKAAKKYRRYPISICAKRKWKGNLDLNLSQMAGSELPIRRS